MKLSRKEKEALKKSIRRWLEIWGASSDKPRKAPPKGAQRCHICGINEIETKNYIEIDGTVHKIPSCFVCVCLNGKSVSTLIEAPWKKRLSLIKGWWKPGKRTTSLPGAYPGVKWNRVRVGRARG